MRINPIWNMIRKNPLGHWNSEICKVAGNSSVGPLALANFYALNSWTIILPSSETIQNPLFNMISKAVRSPLTAEKVVREQKSNHSRVIDMFIRDWENCFLLVQTWHLNSQIMGLNFGFKKWEKFHLYIIYDRVDIRGQKYSILP